jgi:hypothetical protein
MEQAFREVFRWLELRPRLLVVLVTGGPVVGLNDIQREATSVLHAGGAKDGSQGAGCASLLTDNLADVRGSDLEAEHGCVLFDDRLDLDGRRVIYKGLGDLTDERADLGDRI